jgi:phage gp29-like protein
VFWDLLSKLGRDWFSRFMERYGSPFIVGKTDAANKQAVDFLESALSLSTKIGGLVVDEATTIELEQAVTSNAADAYEKFLNVCNREISKVLVGQTTSAEAQATGLGSGVAKFQSEVRDDIRQFDQLKLGETIAKQLFANLLAFNGLPGAVPKAVWGGLSNEDAAGLGELLVSLSNASLEPTDEAIPTIGERVGFGVQRKVAVVAPAFGDPLAAFSVRAYSALNSNLSHPTDKIAAEHAPELAKALRVTLEEVKLVLLSSKSADEFLVRLTHLVPHLSPDKVLKAAERILQKCAASGAASGTAQRR